MTGYFVHFFLKPVQQGLIVFQMPAVNVKPVRFHPAGDAPVFFQETLNRFTQATKHVVAKGPAVQLIHNVELLNIQHNGVHIPGGVIFPEPSGIFIEEAPVEQAGHFIILSRGNELLSLGCFFLFFGAKQQQTKEYRRKGCDECDHDGQVISHIILKADLFFLLGMGRQGRINRHVRHKISDFVQYGVQLMVIPMHGEGQGHIHPGSYRRQLVFTELFG